jgi:hypothetical protein
MVLKVRYLRLTLSMGSKGEPHEGPDTTERSHLGDEWRVRRCSKVMSEKRKFKKSRNWGRVGDRKKIRVSHTSL